MSTLVGRVVDDAKAVARAEIDVIRAKAGLKLSAYRSAAVLFGIGALLALLAIVALAVGTVAILAQSMRPAFATLCAVGGYGALAAVCFILAKRRL